MSEEAKCAACERAYDDRAGWLECAVSEEDAKERRLMFSFCPECAQQNPRRQYANGAKASE